MSQLGYDREGQELEGQTDGLVRALRDTDPGTRVPTCPEWTVADLAAHVGRAHRRAAAIVNGRATAAPRFSDVDDGQLPAGAQPRADWLRAGATALVQAVREAGPDTTVWSWTEDQRAGRWLRRMVHETVVHRVDAELAVGRPFDVAPDLAADGITELLELLASPKTVAFLPALARLRGDGQTLHFHATDDGLAAAGEWLVRRTPSGVTFEHGHGKGDVAVRGRAANLLLVLYGRLDRRQTPAEVDVLGDQTLFDQWLEIAKL
jgi:uncharacterized protein (TIGR03083 family)